MNARLIKNLHQTTFPNLSSTLVLTLLFFLFSYSAFASDFIADYDVEITVVDENGSPIDYATVSARLNGQNKIKPLGNTDFDGKLMISGLSLLDTIVVNYVGYKEFKATLSDVMNRNRGRIEMISNNTLKEVVVVASTKFAEDSRDIPSTIDAITAADIQMKNSGTTADAFEDGGVFVQRTQMGGGSPIIRGFEANKVLIVVDGVRMNNAIYRSGHLQNAITVDSDVLERAEVIYGPAAVVYGSDALGGVLSLTTKDPKMNFKDDGAILTETNYNTRFSSANREKTLHINVSTAGKKWGYFGGFTYSDFDGLRAGSRVPIGIDSIPDHWLRLQFVRRDNETDVFLNNENPFDQVAYNLDAFQQVRTGYSQYDILQKVRYQASDSTYYTLNFQFSNSSDIPRYDRLTETKGGRLKFAEWHYDPQIRLLSSLKMNLFRKENKLFDEGIVVGAFQFVEEDRIKRKFLNLNRTRQREDVYVGSINADFKKNLNRGDVDLEKDIQYKIYYGYEGNFNYVDSYADALNIKTRNIIPERTRYPNGGSTMYTNALYGAFNMKDPESNLSLKTGLRYTIASVLTKYDVEDLQQYIPVWSIESIDIKNRSRLTGSIGLTYTPGTWQFKTLVSSAFRVPNVDDLAKIREKNGFVTVPNPDLTHEYAYNGEVTIAKEFGKRQDGKGGARGLRGKLSFTGFYTYIDNAIIRQPFYLPGATEADTTLVIDGDEARIITNMNAGRATIYGLSTNLSLKLHSNWDFKASYNYIRGRYTAGSSDLDSLGALSHIPPTYGQMSLGYKAGEKDRFKSEFVVRYNLHKPLSEYDLSGGSADNLNQAIPDYGTPAWMTYNIYTSYQLTERFSINAGVENIMDMHYRTFASGISSPGRNFIISINGKF